MTRPVRAARRAAAALCVAAIPFVLTVSADADAAGSFGWWYQLNDSSLPAAPPPPPGAPSGGIYVQGTLAGPSAYGAVRFSSPGTTAGVAKLAVESSNGAVEVAMCPTTSAWQPADGGPWQAKPTFDCATSKALGVLAADGKSVTFQLTDAFGKAGEFDVAIVPDPTAQTVFSLSLTAPGPDFFTPTSNTPPTLPPVEEVPPSIDNTTGGGFDTGSATFPDVGSTTDAGNFLEPTPTAPPAATGGTGGGARSGAGTGRLPTQPVSHTDSSAERVGAAIGLGLLAAALWFTGNRTAGDLTPELVKAGAVSAHGGVGRFARVRTALPTRVA
jgi:hypothetical protein